MPKMKLTLTMTDDQVPTATAIPAMRMAKIPKDPPMTHKNPDNIPKGVNRRRSPNNKVIQDMAKSTTVL